MYEDMIVKCKIIKDESNNKYPYNVQIWKSIDNGKKFYDTGNGDIFETKQEAEAYKKYIESGNKKTLKKKVKNKNKERNR